MTNPVTFKEDEGGTIERSQIGLKSYAIECQAAPAGEVLEFGHRTALHRVPGRVGDLGKVASNSFQYYKKIN
ncbi:hypothetical protein BH23PLA1_BH23PLA1_19090 [soil metagenome]